MSGAPADAGLVDYYRRRAAEYEAIYAKPERQDDLALLRGRVAASFGPGDDVLEIACGTGYWTELIAPRVRSLLAADLAGETLAIARRKSLPPGRVRFAEADAYRLPAGLGQFNAAFAGMWWSHVPRARIGEFLRSLHARLAPGARVVMLDNRYVEGSSTPIAQTDAAGDSWQLRRLADGSTHRVLKNFPTRDQLERDLGAAGFEYTALHYYWLCSYRRSAT